MKFLRRFLVIVGTFIIATGLAVPVQAQFSNDPMVFALNGLGDSGHHIVDPVDSLTWCGDCQGVDYHTGTPWVVNPHDSWPYELPSNGAFYSGCTWDSDDEYSWLSIGNILGAGVTLTIHECRYSDLAGYSQLFTDVGIGSSSSKLIVTERWDWNTGSVSHTFPAVFDSSAHKWRYFGCINSPAPIGGTLVTIPNSNNGQADTMLITITVTNPTGQKVNKTGGFIEAGIINGLSRGCTTWISP